MPDTMPHDEQALWEKEREELREADLDDDTRLQRRITTVRARRNGGLPPVPEPIPPPDPEDDAFPPEVAIISDESPEGPAGEAPSVDTGRQRLRLWAITATILAVIAFGGCLGVATLVKPARAAATANAIVANTATVEARRLRDALAAAAADQIRVEATRDDLQAKLLRAGEHQAALTAAADDATKTLAQSQDDLAKARVETSQALAQVNAAVQGRAGVESQAAQLREQVTNAGIAQQRLQNEYRELADDVQKTRVLLGDRNRRISELESANRLLHDQILQAAKDNAVHLATEAQLRKELDDLRKAALLGR